MFTSYPIAKGLIRQTQIFLGVYNSDIKKPAICYGAAEICRPAGGDGSLMIEKRSNSMPHPPPRMIS